LKAAFSRFVQAAVLILAPPACWPAFLPAASIELRGQNGETRVMRVPARLQDDAGLAERVDAQFRASYYYCLALLAAQRGLLGEAVELLERARRADPRSVLLRRETAALLEDLNRDAEAAALLESLLKEPGADRELQRSLAAIYVRLNRFEDARKLFLGPDGSEPTDAASLRALVALDLAAGDETGAERRLRGVLAAGGDADDREMLAALLQKRGKADEAAGLLRALLKQDPTRVTAWARLGACYEAQGDTLAALQALDQGLQRSPDSALLEAQRGRLSYQAGLFDSAEAAFSRLLELEPQDADALLHRGLARLRAGRYAAAEEDFVALGKLEPASPSQAYGLALALVMQKKYAEGEKALHRVLELNPKAEPAWVQLAALHARRKDPDQAAAVLAHGLKELPQSAELALLLSAARQEQGDTKAALAVLRDFLKRQPDDGVQFRLAVLLDKRGDFAAAEKELRALIKRSPKHAQALNYLAYAWAERGEHLVEAEALVRRALELDPNNHYYLDSLGWILHKQSRHAEAEPILRKASEALDGELVSDPEEVVVFEHWAEVLEALGRGKEAAAARRRAENIRSLAGKAVLAQPPSEEAP
jgi:tetratricopeptide (TPR) repeat protein